VYELKVEFEGDDRDPQGERVEIEYGGMFYRLEPGEHGLVISVVGMPGAGMIVHPRSTSSVALLGVKKLGGI
jgi:hypothetical protein